jgi:hypothetical protein
VYDNYVVSFYIPEGKILAAYDKDGRLLRTAERYKDVAVPKKVREAVAKKYGNKLSGYRRLLDPQGVQAFAGKR